MLGFAELAHSRRAVCYLLRFEGQWADIAIGAMPPRSVVVNLDVLAVTKRF